VTEDSIYYKELRRVSSSKYALSAFDISKESWFEELSKEDFKGALVEIEKDYDPSTAAITRKLWWIRCQLATGQVPSSALTSPLEEIFENLKTSPTYAHLGCSTYLQSSLKLLEKNQMRLSVLMFDRAAELSAKHKLLSREEELSLQNFYLELLEKELVDSKKRRESKDYVTKTETKIEKQKKSLASLKARKNKSESPSQVQFGLNSKAILDKAEQKEADKKQANAVIEKTEGVQTAKKNETKRLKTILAIVSTLLCLALAFISWNTLFPSKNKKGDTSLQEKASSGTINGEPKNLATPTESSIKRSDVTRELSSTSSSSEDSSMNSLNKRIEAIGESKDNLRIVETIPIDQTEDANAEEIDDEALQRSNEIRLPEQKEEELVSIGSEIDAEPIPEARIKPRTSPPIQVGSSGRKAPLLNPNSRPVQPKLPLRNRDPLASRNGEKALDGSPLRSYEVENFDPPITFKTITPTEVLVAPSLLAKSLAKLETGTHIHVTRKMGRWLKLRSKGGNIGYIYAQDATEAFDSN